MPPPRACPPAAPPHDDPRAFEAALWPLVVDGATGELITKDGRSLICGDPRGERFPWS